MCKKEFLIDNQIAYLMGLICGRGHFFGDSKRIVIEFAHANETVFGVAKCLKCGNLITKEASSGIYKCKNINCGMIYNDSQITKTRIIYNQIQSVKNSLKNTIIPFLNESLKVIYNIVGNPNITYLSLDFNKNIELFEQIHTIFLNKKSFDSFRIPGCINDLDENLKKDFLNGLLDCAGFASSGGWIPRTGKAGYGRMRAYIQIVRNRHMVVDIDNFLRDLGLAVQTIDRGHPNIRDSNMEDYFNTNSVSRSREHQIKFYPEFYLDFCKFRISHKQEMFMELANYNIFAGYDNTEDRFPPKIDGKFNIKNVKPYHPGENDPRLPTEIKHRHFESFWQINYFLGCKYLHNLLDKDPNKNSVLSAGKNIQTSEELEIIDQARIKKTEEITERYKNVQKNKEITKKTINTLPSEKSLYAPIANWLNYYLNSIYTGGATVYDTSTKNLDFLVGQNMDILDSFDFCMRYRIKPDLVGFLKEKSNIVFVEIKNEILDLKALGQLLGYCYVANPVEAFLISNFSLSQGLIKLIQAKPEILEYSKGRKVQIGRWHNSDVILNDL